LLVSFKKQDLKGSPAKTFLYTRKLDKHESLRCPTPCHSGAQFRVMASSQYSYLRRCWSDDEPFATLCKIWPVRDLNSRSSACVNRSTIEAVDMQTMLQII